MRVRRPKPYVCVDCDFAEHFRFQATKDLDATAGAWLRCLAYSRAQELDGVVKATWLRRSFPRRKYARVEALVAVGLLRPREDGDFELHAYAPRNQTRAMLEEIRETTRKRVSSWRRQVGAGSTEEPAEDLDGVPEEGPATPSVARYKSVTDGGADTIAERSGPDLDPKRTRSGPDWARIGPGSCPDRRPPLSGRWARGCPKSRMRTRACRPHWTRIPLRSRAV